MTDKDRLIAIVEKEQIKWLTYTMPTLAEEIAQSVIDNGFHSGEWLVEHAGFEHKH